MAYQTRSFWVVLALFGCAAHVFGEQISVSKRWATPCPTPVVSGEEICPPVKWCRFRLNNGTLVLPGSIVGHVDEPGEARVFSGNRYVRISKWRPRGLTQRFTPSFIKVFSMAGTTASGVGIETPQTNQGNFLDGLCFWLPIRAYQLLDAKGNVIDNVKGTRTDCVQSQLTYKP